MTETIGPEAFPLQWPAGKARTKNPTRSKFKTGFGAARNHLSEELRRLGAQRIVLSTNVPLRNDGQPRANVTVHDSGIAVYFTRRGKQTCFACDRWLTVAENLYAVAKTIEALRGIERWGGGDAVDQAFLGFASLPAASWRSVLGVMPGESLADVELRYKTAARVAHPDAGGSADRMAALNASILEARKELGS